MKRLLLIAAVFAALLTFGATAEAGNGFRWGISWNSGHGGHVGHTSHFNHYPSYHQTWHDTSHYDWHPGQLRWHGNHFDYVPGHYDWHQTGHFDGHHH